MVYTNIEEKVERSQKPSRLRRNLITLVMSAGLSMGAINPNSVPREYKPLQFTSQGTPIHFTSYYFDDEKTNYAKVAEILQKMNFKSLHNCEDIKIEYVRRPFSYIKFEKCRDKNQSPLTADFWYMIKKELIKIIYWQNPCKVRSGIILFDRINKEYVETITTMNDPYCDGKNGNESIEKLRSVPRIK